MKISYEPTGINNFHNQNPINLIISGEIDHSDEVYVISPFQASRIRRHFCGVADCQCPAGGVVALDPYGILHGIRVQFCEEI